MKTKTIKINVTQVDIDKGIPRDSSSCPLARAFTRKLGVGCSVGMSYWRSTTPHDLEKWGRLPENARKFRAAFDENKRVKPFSFNLEV